MKLNSLPDLHLLLTDRAKQPAASSDERHAGKGKLVRISLHTKGRKGKSVTIISGLQLNPTAVKDIARILKEHCGAGGTVKDRDIELQGDHRTRAAGRLREMNYVIRQVESKSSHRARNLR
jgi:predicted translation initiation factor SUI1